MEKDICVYVYIKFDLIETGDGNGGAVDNCMMNGM